MYTSCFRLLKRIAPPLEPVAISVGVPPWYRGRREPRLAPTRAMLKMTRGEYDERFAAILARLDSREVYTALGENAVLLCWEAPGQLCHRRYVADWFAESLGVRVPELAAGPRGGDPCAS